MRCRPAGVPEPPSMPAVRAGPAGQTPSAMPAYTPAARRYDSLLAKVVASSPVGAVSEHVASQAAAVRSWRSSASRAWTGERRLSCDAILRPPGRFAGRSPFIPGSSTTELAELVASGRVDRPGARRLDGLRLRFRTHDRWCPKVDADDPAERPPCPPAVNP